MAAASSAQPPKDVWITVGEIRGIHHDASLQPSNWIQRSGLGYKLNATFLSKNPEPRKVDYYSCNWCYRIDFQPVLKQTVEGAKLIYAQELQRRTAIAIPERNQTLDKFAATLTEPYAAAHQKVLDAFNEYQEMRRKLETVQEASKPNQDSKERYQNEEIENYAVSFVLDNGDTVPAHKSVLVKSSPHYKQLLAGQRGFAEIKVQGVSTATIEKYIRFIYLGDIQINNAEEANQLLKLAQENGIAALEARVLPILVEHEFKQLITPAVFAGLLKSKDSADVMLNEQQQALVKANQIYGFITKAGQLLTK